MENVCPLPDFQGPQGGLGSYLALIKSQHQMPSDRFHLEPFGNGSNENELAEGLRGAGRGSHNGDQSLLAFQGPLKMFALCNEMLWASKYDNKMAKTS